MSKRRATSLLLEAGRSGGQGLQKLPERTCLWPKVYELKASSTRCHAVLVGSGERPCTILHAGIKPKTHACIILVSCRRTAHATSYSVSCKQSIHAKQILTHEKYRQTCTAAGKAAAGANSKVHAQLNSVVAYMHQQQIPWCCHAGKTRQRTCPSMQCTGPQDM